MSEQDFYSLAIGYALFCVGIFAFVMITFHRHIRGQATLSEMPKWMLALIVFYSICPILNIGLLINTIKLKPE